MSHSLKIIEQDDNTAIVGGYGVLFGGTDLEGETFTADTDFMLDLVPTKLVFVDHSADSYVERDGKAYILKGIDVPVGHVRTVTPDETGLYMELMFEKGNQYWKFVEQILSSGKAGLSSGSIGHLTRRAGKTITRWPIVETSITNNPAEHRTVSTVERIKQITAANPHDLKATIQEAGEPATDNATAATRAADVRIITNQSQEENNMSEETPTAVARDEFDASQKALNDKLSAIMEHLNSNKAAHLKDAGYIAPDSETDRPNVKSVGDFLIAVARGNVKRLQQVYNARKDISADSGAAGAYLMPEEFHGFMSVEAMTSDIISRVYRQPVATDSGRFPALDIFAAPTANTGATALAGGMTGTMIAPGGAYTETQPTFNEISYVVRKFGGYVEVDNEVVSDSAIAIEALLGRLFRVTAEAKLEWGILRGSGSGEPLGIFNSAAAIGVTTITNNAFALPDAAAMRSRLKAVSGSQPVWIMHPGMYPDLVNFVTTSGGSAWLSNIAGAGPDTLLTYPILYSEHMPAPDSDDVILADLGAYILFDRQAHSVAYSEHAAFTSGKGTWRFDSRYDGKPWWLGTQTLGGDGTFTVSPFVYHND